jgi:alanine racemase
MTIEIHHRPTEAHIDLDALAYNFHSSKQFIGTEVKYMAVVKADGYGHGAIQCSLRLEREGIDWFGVAIPEEGVDLRRAGVKAPILCLGSIWPGQEDVIFENDLTAVVYDQETAGSLNRYAKSRGIAIDIHVKVDTGMGRVGFDFRQSADLAAYLRQLDSLKVNGLMTHFAAADDPNESEHTALQINRFYKVCDDFRRAGHDPVWIDLANSPGAIAYPASHGNMVRLGGALYGLIDDILPPIVPRPDLQPVLSLRSRIAHLRSVAEAESLGYGRTFVTERPSIIALVPIGYADGYCRGLSNRGSAVLNGCIVPIVGRISMDWTLLDVTDVPNVRRTDEVFLIGGSGEVQIKASDIARINDTIAYEITCGISPRIPRVYNGLQYR